MRLSCPSWTRDDEPSLYPVPMGSVALVLLTLCIRVVNLQIWHHPGGMLRVPRKGGDSLLDGLNTVEKV